MPPVGFEPTIPASARPQTYALDGAAIGTGEIVHFFSKPKPVKRSSDRHFLGVYVMKGLDSGLFTAINWQNIIDGSIAHNTINSPAQDTTALPSILTWIHHLLLINIYQSKPPPVNARRRSQPFSWVSNNIYVLCASILAYTKYAIKVLNNSLDRSWEKLTVAKVFKKLPTICAIPNSLRHSKAPATSPYA
jgi:hypothetical protein